MALFGMTVKTRGGRTQTFNVDNINNRGAIKANRTMTNSRLIGTAISLSVGGLMMYSAMHYIPSYFGNHKVLSLSNLDDAAAQMVTNEKARGFLSPYMELFELKRTYLRPGQRIQAKYSLETGSVVELRIRRCQQQFIVEVFNCKVIGERKMTVENKTTGSHEFTFKDAGFYMFDETVVKRGKGKATSYVSWRRG